MTDQTPPDEPIPVPLLWVDLDSKPVLLANQFLGQVQQDEIVLSIGSLVQPPITGATIEERREEAEKIAYIPVHSIVRLTMTRRRVEELQIVLRDTLANYDNRYGG